MTGSDNHLGGDGRGHAGSTMQHELTHVGVCFGGGEVGLLRGFVARSVQRVTTATRPKDERAHHQRAAGTADDAAEVGHPTL